MRKAHDYNQYKSSAWTRGGLLQSSLIKQPSWIWSRETYVKQDFGSQERLTIIRHVIGSQSPWQSLYENFIWTLTHACVETAKLLSLFSLASHGYTCCTMFMQMNLRTGQLTKWTSQWLLMQHATTSRNLWSNLSYCVTHLVNSFSLLRKCSQNIQYFHIANLTIN